MKKNKIYYIVGMLLIFNLSSTTLLSQTNNPNVSPKWQAYYENNPSGIEENYQSSDFIRIAKLVGYSTVQKEMQGNSDLFEKILLSLSQATLKQMMINGWYHSKTYKHDDYFLLYNKYYKIITKDTWDKYCPYLIPLMSIDGVINID